MIQRQDRGAGQKRARFNSSMLDTRLLKAGQNFEEMPDSYVIFITENDVMKQGEPIYRFSRMNEKTHELLNDGSHIIYVNGAYKCDTDPIGKLMHDFRCVDADDMHNRVLSEKVRYFKETEGGNSQMCRIFEDIVKEAEKNANIETALKLIDYGTMPHELIAQACKLSLAEVRALAAEKNT